MERTLSIIKPDGVSKGLIGEVVGRFEREGIRVAAARMVHMSRRVAEGFYAVHKGKGFFDSLVEFMTSGPCLVMVLEGENVIERNRELMGATDPAKADPNTIRADYADSVQNNIVHGSDAPETAAVEIAYFFPESEIF